MDFEDIRVQVVVSVVILNSALLGMQIERDFALASKLCESGFGCAPEVIAVG